MHHILYQTFDAADLRHHERRVFRLHAKHHAHFQLHRETVFRNHFEWIERVGNFARSPFHRLVRRRNHGRTDGEGVDVVSTWANDCLLNTTITFRHDVSLVSAFVETSIGWIASHQVLLDLFDCALIVYRVEAGCRLLSLFAFLALHSLPDLCGHLAPDVI